MQGLLFCNYVLTGRLRMGSATWHECNASRGRGLPREELIGGSIRGEVLGGGLMML